MKAEATTSTTPRIWDDGHRLKVEMRARRVHLLIATLVAWCLVWAYGEWTALSALVRELPSAGVASMFVVVWLLGWTAAGLASVAMLAFLWDGREIVTVDDRAIVLRAEALGRGLDRTYDLQRATNLRPVAVSSNRDREFLAFDYSGRTVTFGTGLHDEDAERVAREITTRWPHLHP